MSVNRKVTVPPGSSALELIRRVVPLSEHHVDQCREDEVRTLLVRASSSAAGVS